MVKQSDRVLITGACGSVGSELVKSLLNIGCTVCAFDNSEDRLFKLDQDIDKNFRSQIRLFFGDIRDFERLNMAFKGVDIVFHCAALKHVYLSEYNPFEAIKTNLNGVNNVIKAALENKVSKVLFTSSDKAVNPTSTMGATKLIGERLCIAANNYSGNNQTRFSCVRFGNILNSNGSVLKIFKSQLREGKFLSITSTKMSRFFITKEEAIELCLLSCSDMLGGEIFVLYMGSANILDIAKLAANTNEPKIKEIGLKAGEKLYEELVTDLEAKRTIKLKNYFLIIPETLDILPEKIKVLYKKFDSYPRLNKSIRSDDKNGIKLDLDKLKSQNL
tara:strand:+ start:416 stop:1411 length:996 start_codon:yes stop_codon:yes gene_type:complete